MNTNKLEPGASLQQAVADGVFGPGKAPLDVVAQYHHVDLHLQSMPGPLPILGPFFGFTRSRMAKACSLRILNVGEVIDRDLTWEEADAVCYHTCKELQITSAGPPIGAMIGTWRAWATADSWRLPMWSVKENFNPEVVALPNGKTLLQGQMAKSFWRTLRYSLYAGNSALVGFVLCASYATSVAAVGMNQDPRLKSCSDELAQTVKEKRAEFERMAQESRPARRQDGILSKVGTRQGEHQHSHVPAHETGRPVSDDASPTGGEFAKESTFEMEASPESRPNASSAGSSAASYGQMPSRQQSQMPQQPQEPPAMGGFYDVYDDASPTAPQQPQATRAPAPTGGSAWDRIRRGGTHVPSPASRSADHAPSNPQAVSDPRSQAQREFDEGIEKERRGGEFAPRGR
jgi:hypothetical protein